MSPKNNLTLVTGASGFVGAQIVDSCLQAGYSARGTCRSKKSKQLRENCRHPDFEVATIDDLVDSDLSAVLKDVIAIIHVATPVPGHNEDMLKVVAVDGTMNILRQAYAAKIYNVCIIGSLSSTVTDAKDMLDPTKLITENDWNTITEEEAHKLAYASSKLYVATKALSERAAWAFAAAHPEMNLTIILPPFIYGPLSPTHVVTNPSMLATDAFVYMLIAGRGASYPPTVSPHCVDVRDVARAAVQSLSIHRSNGARYRILLWGGAFTWKQAVRHLAEAKPELKDRLLPMDGGEEEVRVALVETRGTREVLGMESFIGWRTTLEDTVASLLEMERSCQWAS